MSKCVQFPEINVKTSTFSLSSTAKCIELQGIRIKTTTSSLRCKDDIFNLLFGLLMFFHRSTIMVGLDSKGSSIVGSRSKNVWEPLF
jgi:hypothetical protein